MDEEHPGYLRTPEQCLRFLSAFAHELRTPLASFGMLADLLFDSAGARLGEPERRYCENMREVARDMQGLVGEMAELVRLLDGRAGARTGDVALERLVEEAEAAVRMRAWARGVALGGSLDPALPRRLRGDAERLRRILELLLGAAAGQARSEVSYRLDLQGDDLRVTVSSDGPPLPEAGQDVLFEPFGERLQTARAGGGRSLALPLALELARLLGGTLEAANRGGRPTFDLVLPAAGG